MSNKHLSLGCKGRAFANENGLRTWPEVAAEMMRRHGIKMTASAAWSTCKRAETKIFKALTGGKP